jgi:hypothetical protein
MHKAVHLLPAVALAVLAGCQNAAEHAAQVRQAQATDERTTLGTVQREIRIGMEGADVIAALGAPNMVTTDDKRRETWVYDKVATETVSSGSSGGAGVLFLGGFTSGASATSTSQRTLTVIVKFDETTHVRDFAYRASSF